MPTAQTPAYFFRYGPDGHRTHKYYRIPAQNNGNGNGNGNGNTPPQHEHALYVRDLQGNILATYNFERTTTVTPPGNSKDNAIRNAWLEGLNKYFQASGVDGPKSVWALIRPNTCTAEITPTAQTAAQNNNWAQFVNQQLNACGLQGQLPAVTNCHIATRIQALQNAILANNPLQGAATLNYIAQLSGNKIPYQQNQETLTEAHLYGISRLGLDDQNRTYTLRRYRLPCSSAETQYTAWVRAEAQLTLLPSTTLNNPTPTVYASLPNVHIRGHKRFELSNHLGNVLAVISDKHLAQDVNNDTQTDFYYAHIISAQDYGFFGSTLAGRTYQNPNLASTYRFANCTYRAHFQMLLYRVEWIVGWRFESRDPYPLEERFIAPFARELAAVLPQLLQSDAESA
jgi:hypothetical protein